MEEIEMLKQLAHQSVDCLISDLDRKYAEKIWHKAPEMPKQSGEYLVVVYTVDWDQYSTDYAFYDRDDGWSDQSGRPYGNNTVVTAWQERVFPEWLKNLLVPCCGTDHE